MVIMVKTLDYHGGLVAANSGSWYSDKAFYLYVEDQNLMAHVGNKSTSQFVSSGKWSHLVLTITDSKSNKDGYQFFYNGSRVYHGTFDWFKRMEDMKMLK